VMCIAGTTTLGTVLSMSIKYTN